VCGAVGRARGAAKQRPRRRAGTNADEPDLLGTGVFHVGRDVRAYITDAIQVLPPRPAAVDQRWRRCCGAALTAAAAASLQRLPRLVAERAAERRRDGRAAGES
jgi:hypothetical protein